MQQPVGHDQRAYSTGMLQPNGKRYFCQIITHIFLTYLLSYIWHPHPELIY